MKVNKNINNKKTIIIGIQLLRIIFSFHILVFHCINKLKYQSKIIKWIINNVGIDLCTFFIISFYFSYNSFSSRNILKIKHRFKRFFIPYIIWPNIFFIINFFTHYNYKIPTIEFKLLYYQLIIGYGFHLVFWFLFNIIFISLIFSIIIFLSKKRYFLYLFLIAILFSLLGYYMNHSKFFSFYQNNIVFPPIKSISSSYLFSLTGFYLFSIHYIELLKKYKIKIKFLCVLIIYLYIFYKKSIGNSLFILNIIKILCSVSLLTIFLLFPFSKLNHSLFSIIIKQLSSYSGGIYYIHTKVQIYLDLLSKEMSSRTLLSCIINYLICNIICFIGLKTFKKTSLRYLFI